MTIHIASRRRKLATIEKMHPGAIVYDVTSKGTEPWVRFSPLFPHGNIPMPDRPCEDCRWKHTGCVIPNDSAITVSTTRSQKSRMS